jgi:predicted nucleotidyltransferase
VVERKGTGIEENFGLEPKDLELIRQVFRRHPEVREVRVFGSRAAGRFEDYSDIDLALWGDLNPALIARIRGELEELPLPYTFDVQAYDAIKHPPLKRHIDEIGKTVPGTDFNPPAAAQNHSSP